jgi:hypothetical protein
MSFTDGKPRRATEEDLNGKWAGKGNAWFRCYMCGYKFELNDYWRFIYSDSSTFTDIFGKKWGMGNALVCEKCDGPDVLDRWKKMHEEAYNKYWNFTCQEHTVEIHYGKDDY